MHDIREDEPCTCTIACIPQGLTSGQVCRLTLGELIARNASAFAAAYDERRSWRANLAAAELASSDVLPACPRCKDLLPVGSLYCLECGCKVVV